MITERDWDQLEADRHAHGSTVRRVDPHSVHDMFIAVRHPDNARMLTLTVGADTAAEVLRRIRELPRTRGLEMQFARLNHHSGQFCVVLTDPSLREVFNPLATDIAATVDAEPSAARAVLAAVARFEHWRQMLQSLADSGLSDDSRRGLFGELSMLRDHLLPALHGTDAVRSWAGPTGAHQDFQFPHAAIEVKTSTGKEPQTLVVTSERELDDTGTGYLILAHLSLDERRGGSGESLNAIVDSVLELISDVAAREFLSDMLVRTGYMQQQRDLYDEPRYTIRSRKFWHVAGDFPRITEADLRPGVGDCKYRVSTVGLDQYALAAQDVVSAIQGELGE